MGATDGTDTPKSCAVRYVYFIISLGFHCLKNRVAQSTQQVEICVGTKDAVASCTSARPRLTSVSFGTDRNGRWWWGDASLWAEQESELVLWWSLSRFRPLHVCTRDKGSFKWNGKCRRPYFLFSRCLSLVIRSWRHVRPFGRSVPFKLANISTIRTSCGQKKRSSWWQSSISMSKMAPNWIMEIAWNVLACWRVTEDAGIFRRLQTLSSRNGFFINRQSISMRKKKKRNDSVTYGLHVDEMKIFWKGIFIISPFFSARRFTFTRLWMSFISGLFGGKSHH